MKLRIFTAALAMLALVGIWSCGPAENEVTFDMVTSNEFPTRGDSVKLTITASSELENLSSIQIRVTSVDTNGAELLFLEETQDLGDLSFEGEFSFEVDKGVKFGESINVVVTAKDALDGSFEYTNSDGKAVAYMKMYRAGAQMGHFFGTINGGFNLVDAIEAYKDAPNSTKDIVDQSEQKKDLSNTLSANTESNTQYVDLGEDFTIADIHTASIEQIYTERAPSTLIVVAEGTKFLAQLRGGTDYAVVHITAIEPDFGEGTAESTGRYIFDIYKLQ
ncbi:MAG: hypothetical protein ACPGLV_11800 [Bacteroidia bacterium]